VLYPPCLTCPLLCLPLLSKILKISSLSHSSLLISSSRNSGVWNSHAPSLRNLGSLRDSTGNRAIPWVHPGSKNKMLISFTYYKFSYSLDPVRNSYLKSLQQILDDLVAVRLKVNLEQWLLVLMTCDTTSVNTIPIFVLRCFVGCGCCLGASMTWTSLSSVSTFSM